MSPAVDRGIPPEEEMMVSAGSSFPTLVAGQEGWLHYKSDEDRWYWWNGTDWLKLAITPLVAGDVPNNLISNAMLRDSAALSVIGRSANSTGDPADIAVAAGSGLVLRESGSTLGFGQVVSAGIADDSIGSLKLKTDAVSTVKIQDNAVTLAKVAHGSSGGASIFCASDTGTPELKQIGTAPAYPFVKDLTSSVVWPKVSGTTFPTSPVDGQIFTHTTHRCMYFYDVAAAGWLSTAVFSFDIGTPVDTSATAYMGTGPALAGDIQFTDTNGYKLGFAAKVVGLNLSCDASTTGTIQVFDDGTAVTSASLALSAETTKADDALMSATIGANSVIGAKVTSGTVQGPAFGQIRLRRFET